jgi:hypothetical protein
MELLVLLSFALVSVIAQNCSSFVCSEDNYVQHYFSACLADSQCTNNLNLHSDEAEFFHYIFHTELLRPKQLTWNEICRSDAYPIVLADLRTHEFCSPNHVLDGNRGCVCRHDKSCQERTL